MTNTFKEIKRYGLVSVTAFILTTTTLFIFVDILKYKTYIVGPINFAIIFFLRFAAEKFFVFKRKL